MQISSLCGNRNFITEQWGRHSCGDKDLSASPGHVLRPQELYSLSLVQALFLITYNDVREQEGEAIPTPLDTREG